MKYEYKITTHGMAVMAACWDLEKPLKVTRVAFGSGMVDEGVNLADVHQLVSYVSDGAEANRRHEDNRLFLTIQYANSEHPLVDQMFFLSEFIVCVKDPETGEETDLLYGTLGDYRQPVPPHDAAYPPSVFNFPLEIVVSNEIHVESAAPAGLVTYEDLNRLASSLAIRKVNLEIPDSDWTEETEGAYRVRIDLPVEGVTDSAIPQLTILPEGEVIASACGISPAMETVEGAVRIRAVKAPEQAIPASLILFRDSTGLVFQMGPGGGNLPTATEEQAGVVKPGKGLLVSPDGTLEVNAASDEDILKALELDSGGEVE